YRPGKSVELLDGTFIRIRSIVERITAEGQDVLLRGPRFKRCKYFNGLLPPKLNEVAMYRKEDNVSVSCICRLRILILTNASFPAHNDVKGRTKAAVENEGKLVCRWEVSIPTSSATMFMSSGILRRLREDEADSMFRVSDRLLQNVWRGSTVCASTSSGRYTFGDAFCGGGGMACGARAAGFINSWGFDHDLDACNTYSKNFPDAQVYPAPVDLFLTALAGKELQVDVVHLSPPCQPHSVAHTIAGKDDENNEAAGLCITTCLEKIIPRFATFEQAFGLVYRLDWFRAAVSGFIAAGFSVQWDILHCVQYGVPQTRRRLFMIASCPGERLPPFPKPTYGLPSSSPEHWHELGLLPPRTLRDAIGHLDPDADKVDEIFGGPHLRFSEPRLTPQLWDAPLKATVKAGSGCYDVHPSFLRRFTVRELACIQTFPEHHQFEGVFGQQRRQVGNAVPPVMAEALLRQVRKALEESD
ncbi:S-adenosyl-L-methionine-dependent methyltransferase, partial [Trichophaea hybrida]